MQSASDHLITMITVTCLINVCKICPAITYGVCVDPSTLKPLIREELLSRITQQDRGLQESATQLCSHEGQPHTRLR